MILTKRTNQGGSILTFIIIATVLAAVVIGTAYFVKQRGERVRDEQATAQADKIAKETDKPAEATSETQDTSSKPATVPGATEPTEQTVLPTTGAELDVSHLLAIGLLVSSVFIYISSRRALNPSL